MKENNSNYIRNLINVCSVQSSTGKTSRMNKYIKGQLKQIANATWYMDNGNIYASKGQSNFYPCIVSHTDTVHDIHKDYKIINNDGYLIALSGPFRVGTGGDDKVGIFICLELLKILPVCKVAFFRDEESGCNGSRLADAKFFENVGYVMQADRKGCTGITQSLFGVEMLSKEFMTVIGPVIKAHKRKYIDGMMTDVQELARKFNVSMCNIECGYYEPHSDNEYIIMNDVLRTLVFMFDCIQLLGLKRYECKHTYTQIMTSKWSYYERNYAKYSRLYPDLFNDYSAIIELTNNTPICPQCMQSDVQHDPEYQDWFCLNCLTYLNEIKRLYA